MPSEHPTPAEIRQLEGDWIGREVAVRAGVARLSRFAGRVGRVHAVNWNGRCLVTFDRSEDAGWYDVEPELLTRIEPPPAD